MKYEFNCPSIICTVAIVGYKVGMAESPSINIATVVSAMLRRDLVCTLFVI